MKICNSIVCLDTKRHINLEKLAKDQRYTSKFNSKKFPGLSLKIKDPKTTVLIFKSGKLVCTGGKTVEAGYMSLHQVLDILNFPESMVGFAKAQNYVGSDSVDHRVDLQRVYEKCSPNAVFEPEIFPGLKYTMKEQRVTVLIFSTGKYVITGSKYLGDLYRADVIIRNLLSNCSLK